jgi:hypothetical protein
MPLKRIVPVAFIAALAVITAVAISLDVEPEQPEPSAGGRDRSGTLGNAAPSVALQPASQGHVGFEFPANLTRPPTADEAQSKLWFHDGSWWGLLMERSTSASHIYRLEPDSQTWTDTGALVDDRIESRADALWDGAHLYVATGGASAIAGEHARLMRYSYDSAERTYSLDAGFPVQLTETGVKRLTIARDTTGKLWIAYVLDDQVWISHSIEADDSWAAPYRMPVEGSSVAADHAVILAYGDKVGVVWSNQVEAAVLFASHTDGSPADSWTVTSTPLEGGQSADDHIEVGSLDGPEGTTVFIAVKTSLDTLADSQSTDPQIILLELRPDGRWRAHVFGVLRDRHTQPLLLIDEDARELYLFAVAPFGAGSVYYKRTSADEISLPPGLGTPFLHWPDGPQITTPTSTKQNVGSASGLVVLAADVATGQYVHGVLDPATAGLP